MCARDRRIPIALLLVSLPAFGQGSLDLDEADARNAAYDIMAASEEQFDCKLAEHSIEGIGLPEENRYVVKVVAEGDECSDAMVYLTNMAAREDKLLFRQFLPLTAEEDAENGPLIFFDRELLHEVNPEIEEDEPH